MNTCYVLGSILRMHEAQSLQSCLTLYDTMDHSPPGSTVHRILQARILEWVAVPSSRESFQPKDQTQASYVSWLAGGFFITGTTREVHGLF